MVVTGAAGSAGTAAAPTVTTMTDPAPPADAPFPHLTDDHEARLLEYGVRDRAHAGEALFGPGQTSYDFILLETATVDMVRPATVDLPEAVVARHGPGRFSASSTCSPDRPPT